MSQTTVSLIDVSTYLPGEPISAEYYAQFAESDELRDNLMFRAPKFRHHVGPDETAIDMIERATTGLVERHGQDVIANVDILISHTQMPDVPFYGAGGGIAHRLGMRPDWVLDLHNGGCAAFVLGMQTARQLLSSGAGRTALVAVAQNAAGQIFDQPGVRRKAQAAVPGDGAAVGLLTLSDESPILDVESCAQRVAQIERRFSTSSVVRTGNTPATWRSRSTRIANGGSQAPAKATSASPNPRSPKSWLGETVRCPRSHMRCATESVCAPRTSTYSSRISPTGRSCATGVKRLSCRAPGMSTPSMSAATCSPQASRSTSTARSRTVTFHLVTRC